MDCRLLAVHPLAQSRQHGFDDVHGMRNRNRHQNEYGGRALAEQRHAGPADESRRGQDDGDDHQDDGDRAPNRAQHEYRDQQHRPERDGPQKAEFFVKRVAHGTIEGELAGDVVLDARILRPGLGGSVVEVVDHLYLGRLPILANLG